MQILQKIDKYKKQVSLCQPGGEGCPNHPAWAALLSPARLTIQHQSWKKKTKRKNQPEMKASFGRKYRATFLAQIEQIISGLYSAVCHRPGNSEQFGQAISLMLSKASPPTASSQIVLVDTGSLLFLFLNHCSFCFNIIPSTCDTALSNI